MARSWVSRPSTIGPSRVDGVGVVVGDRLVAVVAAGHHERAADTGEEQVVERAVGQEHAQLGEAGRHPVGHPIAGGAPGEHDRAGAGETSARLGRRRRGRTAGGRRRGRPPSPRRACRRGPCAGAARPRRRRRWRRRRGGSRRCPSLPTIAPVVERGDGSVEGGIAERPGACRRRRAMRARGPQAGTGVGLGVEAAVAGIVVLGAARRAHGERRPWSWPGGRRGPSSTIV